MEVLKEYRVNDRRVLVGVGDITEEVVDAIVNAANSYLKHGGGVARAIVRKGGRIIQEESDRIGYVPVGQVAVTSAGKLPARYVIHAVGPRWGEGDEDEKLRSAVANALAKAEELGLTSIALPAISMGIFGFPRDRGTRIILETVVEFLRNRARHLQEVRLVDISRDTAEHYLAAARSLGLESGNGP